MTRGAVTLAPQPIAQYMCRTMRWTTVAVLTILALACGSDGTGPPPGGNAPPTNLRFVAQPSLVVANEVIVPAVQVELRDSTGTRVLSATNTVTIALGANPGGATLSGTTIVNAVAGVARFVDLALDASGTGYTFVASAGTLTSATSAPLRVAAPLTAVRVSAGGDHTCAIASGGVTYCWGRNLSGQVGDSTMASPRVSPVPVHSSLTFETLAAGYDNTCGIIAGGTAYCWGGNLGGRLGDSTDTIRVTPTPVHGGIAFVTVKSAFFHTCGLAISGAAYCWGYANVGQLGDSNLTPHTAMTPAPVAGGITFTSVSTMNFHACGVTVAGAAECWGDNQSGEIGDSTVQYAASPTPVMGGLTFATISAGFGHSCGVTPSGVAYCWGHNAYGQLGDGTYETRKTPVVVGPNFSAIFAGGTHTCGLTPAGLLYCWGLNQEGQLGDGTFIGHSTPVPVAGGLHFSDVSVGFGHTCGVTTTGLVYCWGMNGNGQLGNGTQSSSNVPIRVMR